MKRSKTVTTQKQFNATRSQYRVLDLLQPRTKTAARVKDKGSSFSAGYTNATGSASNGSINEGNKTEQAAAAGFHFSDTRAPPQNSKRAAQAINESKIKTL